MKTTPRDFVFARWILGAALLWSGVSLYAADAPAATPAANAAVNTAIVPVPQRLEDRLPQNAVNGFNRQHQQFVERAQQGNIDVLFVGDSITQGWPGPGKAVWEQYYAPMKAAEFGIGYDRTQHVLWRLQNGEGQGFQPKVVVLMIGTNNLGPNTVPQTAEGIAAVVKELRHDFPAAKILLLGIFPRDVPGSINRQRVADTNKIIAKLNDGQHVFYLDIGPKFLDPAGVITPDIMADRPPLHPTAKGYEIWAAAIQEPLANLLKPPVPAAASAVQHAGGR